MIRKTFIRVLVLAQLVVAAGAAHAATLTGKVSVAGSSDDADAVVSVDVAGAAPAAGKKEAVMDQQGMSFVPHVLAVQVGTTVVFKNSDAVSHNVFTPDQCAGQFNLGTWGKGEERSHTFDKPCAAVILCALHPDMEGYVVAVPTPYFAVTGADGTFTIQGVPEGTHTVKVWHPGGKESSRQVKVSGDTQVDLQVGG